MSNNNWIKWGDDIRRTVDYSIRSGDFSRLNRDIGHIIEDAVDNVHQEINKAGDRLGRQKDSGVYKQQNPYNVGAGASLPPRQVSLYKNTDGALACGVVLMVIGIIGTASFAGSLIPMLIKCIFRFWSVSIGELLGCSLMAVLLGCSIVLLCKSAINIGRINRFRYYVKYLGKKMTCTMDDLAAAFGRKTEFVRKDVEKMIRKGYFLEGHLDPLENRLIVSDEYYNQYRWAKEQYLVQEQQRVQEERKKNREEAEIPENVRQIIAEGEAFIKKIHASNDAIPGEEISAKIDRMEEIVRKIFQRVRQKPELASDMKKMMSYYLPTTIKLLDVYEEIDAQPIQGENMKQSKLEIEQTMDTLNVAFEKLLDSFYQETAWDVSSDISVLQTMLAQEGLTESDFR